MTTVSSRLGRILSLIPYLAHHPGVRLGELSDATGIPPAALRADLDRVNLCGVPPYSPGDYVSLQIDDDDRVHLRAAEHFARPVRLTIPEALALMVALDSAPASAGGPFAREARSLRERLRAALPVPESGARIVDAGETDAVLATLRAAMAADRRVRIEYLTAGTGTLSSREVSPRALVAQGGTWYLAGHCHARDDARFFRVDRIRSLEESSARRFDPDGLAGDAPDHDHDHDHDHERPDPRPSVRVRIRFDAAMARHVEEVFVTGEIRSVPPEDPGAGEEIELTLESRGVGWLLGPLLPFGSSARVLEPPQLVEEIRRACTTLLGAHATANGSGGQSA